MYVRLNMSDCSQASSSLPSVLLMQLALVVMINARPAGIVTPVVRHHLVSYHFVILPSVLTCVN